jgi:hypothetical protein
MENKVLKCVSAFLFLFLLAFQSAAQKEENGKIKIEITREINGEKKTFKGQYNSEEEMKADPNYQEFVGKDDRFRFYFDGDSDTFLQLDELKDMQRYFFSFDSDEDQDFFFHFDQDSTPSKFQFMIDDFDFENIEEELEKLGLNLKEMLRELDVDDVRKSILIEIKTIEIEDVEGDEFGKKGQVKESSLLELEDLQFYPNPSPNGQVRVRFTVPDEDELSIKVFDLEGREVFNRYFERFGGTYSESIDLSDQQEGIYLLEIKQSNKRVTKKIIVN